MNALWRQYGTLICTLGLAATALLALGMLVSVAVSGRSETQAALDSGKRFIIHVEDGKVEGKAAAVEAAADQASQAEAQEPVYEASEAEEVVVEVGELKNSASPITEPSDDLQDKLQGSVLPRISSKGVKPWQYYAKSFQPATKHPQVALIITGLGQSKKPTEMALGLDESLSLSFSPYAPSLGSWSAASRLTGHEMLLDVSFQTSSYPTDDPGQFSMMLTRSNTENIKNLHWVMSRLQGYIGLMTPVGEVVTPNADTFKPISDEIAKRGVLIVLGSMAATQEEQEHINRSMVSINTDVWIDEELNDMTIEARLATLEQTAQRNGIAIGRARAYPITLKQIERWQKGLNERNIELVPLSHLVKQKHVK